MTWTLEFIVLGVLVCSPFCAGNCPFYNFRIGDFKATILSDGSTPYDPSLVFKDTPVEAVERTLRANFLTTNQTQFYFNVLYVNMGDKQILFDCGSGVNFGPDTGKLVESMEAAGLDPNDIDDIIFSHGHVDHLGGALKPGGSQVFPNAKYHISRQEEEYWRNATLDDLPVDYTDDWKELFLRIGKDTLDSVAEKLVLFELGDEVMPGIKSMGLIGHTPGHSGFIIKSRDDSLLFSGDTFLWDFVSIENPEWRSVFDTDKDAAIAARFSLLDELSDSKMLFQNYHDSFPGLGHIARNRHGFSYRPVHYRFN